MLRCRVQTCSRYLAQLSSPKLSEIKLSVLVLVAWYCEVDAMRNGQGASVIWARCADRGQPCEGGERRKGGPLCMTRQGWTSASCASKHQLTY